MSKRSKALDIVFHPKLFAVAFLLCLALAIFNIRYFDVIPGTWRMALFILLIVFGLTGFFVDEMRS